MSDEIKEMNFSEMLFNRDERLLDYITNLQQENDRLNNITNELEEWLKDKLFNKTNFDVDEAIENLAYSKVLDKLKELKENNNAKD